VILFFALFVGCMQLMFSQATVATRYNNRIGLTGGGGAGFESIPVAVLTDGTKASISFGSGTLVQFEYGIELSRHFDLAFDFGGQFAELDKTVDNASMSFNRSVLSLTPSYIIPLHTQADICFKIGAGIDYFYNADLDFDLSEIPDGVKDDWKYNGGVAEHLSLFMEYTTAKRFSFAVGVKVHNGAYEFKSGGNSYPLDDNMKKTNGGGVEGLFGVYYNFNFRK
jgi:hypothetical protein